MTEVVWVRVEELGVEGREPRVANCCTESRFEAAFDHLPWPGRDDVGSYRGDAGLDAVPEPLREDVRHILRGWTETREEEPQVRIRVHAERVRERREDGVLLFEGQTSGVVLAKEKRFSWGRRTALAILLALALAAPVVTCVIWGDADGAAWAGAGIALVIVVAIVVARTEA